MHETVYFISDAHFGADLVKERESRRRFHAFLDHVHDTGTALYIVGDLFDFWFEYTTAIPKHTYSILRHLSELADANMELHYLPGNHDLWLGHFIRDEVGAQVYDDGLSAELQGLRLYIVHGDGLARSDWGYRVMKRIFRSRTNIFLFRWLHPDIGIPLARILSRKSRDKGENRRELEYVEYARLKLSEGYDVVLMGHTHRPRMDLIDGGVYINLGDWMEKFTFAVLESGSLSLLRWSERGVEQMAAWPQQNSATTPAVSTPGTDSAVTGKTARG